MTEHAALAAAVERLLQPLADLLVRNGVPHAAFAELAKQAYVEAARRRLRSAGARPTMAAIAVATGLTRKDVSRLEKDPPPDAHETAARYQRAARVITGWIRDPRFATPAGEPRPLATDGEPDSFADLVRAFSGDIPPSTMLLELERCDAVERTPDGRLRLTVRAYLPRQGEAEKLQILGTDVAGLISTIAHNLDVPPAGAWLQRKVFYDNLPAHALDGLQRLATQEGQRLLERLDRYLAEHDLDAHPDPAATGGHRAGVGLYYFEEPSPDGPRPESRP